MSASIKVIDAMLAVVMQLTRSPDGALGAAATEELQELAKRRTRLLNKERPPTNESKREIAAA